MRELFVSEPIKPAEGSFDTSGMSAGLPGVPMRFVWRKREYVVAEVLERWNETGPDVGGKERYLRKHWFRLRTAEGDEARIYVTRQPGTSPKSPRWWLYSFSRHDLE